jgi:TIR domain-containing protein
MARRIRRRPAGEPVKIFISYASEQRPIAEKIAFTLRGRGHLTIFDKDDLPPAQSYDEQIARAIGQVELMVFLISPESVASGRYTLTELLFARKRWPSASGRVLPVLVSPTPIAQIPVYLSSIQILTPEGNTAAEVAAEVDQITPTAKPGRILPIAIAMGVASGLISAFVNWSNASAWAAVKAAIGQALGPWIGFLLEPLGAAAPYVFPLVIGTLLVFWDRMPAPRALLTFPIVAAGWICAYWLAYMIVLQYDQSFVRVGMPSAPQAEQCSSPSGEGLAELSPEAAAKRQSLCDEIDKYRRQIEPVFERLGTVIQIFAGLAAGFTGALITALGLGRISRRMRGLDAITLITLVGMAAGILLVMRNAQENRYLLLFVVWQPAVAAAIAWQLTKPVPREMTD